MPSNENEKLKDIIIAVIPAFNEEDRIGDVIAKTLKYVDEVIVINDCSHDNTSMVSVNSGATVINLPENKGAGYATRVGCDCAFQKGANIILTIDSDGQHDPGDIPALLSALVKEDLDIVFGYRPRNQNMPIVNKIGGTILFKLSQILFQIDIEDTQTGFHAFTKECYPKLRWDSNRYGFVSEFVFRVSKHNLRYKEVTVKTIYNENKKGMRKRDGIKSMMLMVYWKIKNCFSH